MSNNNFKDDFEKNRQSIDPKEHKDDVENSVNDSVDNVKEEVSDKKDEQFLQEMLKGDSVEEKPQRIKMKIINLILMKKTVHLVKLTPINSKITIHHQNQMK
ncbi:hypothetical protein AABD37_00575 [Staphylococcus nepalensis]